MPARRHCAAGVVVLLGTLGGCAAGEQPRPAGQHVSTPRPAASPTGTRVTTATSTSPVSRAARRGPVFPCPRGPVELGSGVTGMAFCGSGQVAGRIEKARFAVADAECLVLPAAVSVNAGVAVFGMGDAADRRRAELDHVSIVVGVSLGAGPLPAATAGDYSSGSISLAVGGQVANAVGGDGFRITLDPGRQSGSFAATSIEGAPISGTFRCHEGAAR